MRRRTTSSTAIRFSAFRSPAIPIRSARSGSRCAMPAPARAPCWCRPRRSNGRSIRQAARHRIARSCTSDERTQALLWRAGAMRRAARRRQRTSPLKDPKDFVLIGKPLKRLDTPDKVNGKAVYGIDAMLPDMKFATLAACPVFGGKVGKVDDSAAKKIPGVQQDRRAGRSGRGGRRSHVGGQEGPRRARRSTWNEGANARHQFEGHLGRICAPPAKRTAWSPNPSAISPRASRPARSSRRLTSCRSSRMRPWSR